MKFTAILFPFLLAWTCQDAPQTATTQRSASVPHLAELPSPATVVFLGDSITWHNGFTGILEQVMRSWFPDKPIRLINRGLRGDTAPGALARLDRDIVPFKPDWVVIMLGMNDSGYKGVNHNLLSYYLDNMAKLIQALRKTTKARLLLLTPTCMDPADYNGKRNNPMLALMAEGLMQLGARNKTPVIDLHQPFCQVINQGRKLSPPIELMADAIHPNPTGHAVLTDLLLARLLDPPKAHPPIRVQVTDGQPNHIDLPIVRSVFLPDRVRIALGLSPGLARLMRRPLSILGLQGSVELFVDEQPLGTFPAAQLDSVLDLNSLALAPWVRRAAEISQLLRQRWQIQYALWDPEDVGWQKALTSVEEGEIPIQATSRENLQQLLERVNQRIDQLEAPAHKHRLHWKQVGS